MYFILNGPGVCLEWTSHCHCAQSGRFESDQARKISIKRSYLLLHAESAGVIPDGGKTPAFGLRFAYF